MISRQLHPSFGAELEPHALHDPTGIRQKLTEYGLLLLRDVSLDDHGLADLARAVGDGRLGSSVRSRTHSRSVPEVSNLTNLRDPDGEPLGHGANDTDFWHSDQEFRTRPATLAMLYCLIPPSESGETTFASTDVRNSGVPAEDVDVLRNARSCRRPAPADDHDLAPQVVVSHSVVLRHPRSSRETLYISEHAFDLTLANDTATRPSIAGLLSSITRPGNRYKHVWRQGDLLVFDNTQLIHRRESFRGLRWLKSLKIFASSDWFATPEGISVGSLSTS